MLHQDDILHNPEHISYTNFEDGDLLLCTCRCLACHNILQGCICKECECHLATESEK